MQRRKRSESPESQEAVQGIRGDRKKRSMVQEGKRTASENHRESKARADKHRAEKRKDTGKGAHMLSDPVLEFSKDGRKALKIPLNIGGKVGLKEVGENSIARGWNNRANKRGDRSEHTGLEVEKGRWKVAGSTDEKKRTKRLGVVR